MIFGGVSFALSGFASLKASQLRQAMVENGGVFVQDLCKNAKDVTHLVTFDNFGENLLKILVHGASTVKLVTEHWVEDCVNAGKFLSEDPYLIVIDDKQRQDLMKAAGATPVLPLDFFSSKVFYFHNYDEIIKGSRSASVSNFNDKIVTNRRSPESGSPVVQMLNRAGGRAVVSLSSDITHCLLPFKDDPILEQLKQNYPSVKIRTIFWLADAVKSVNIDLEPCHPLHFPRLSSATPIFPDAKISVTGYIGIDRERLRTMISLLGGTYTGDFTASHTLLVAVQGSSGEKLKKALEWHVPVVDASYIENCYMQGRRLPLPCPLQNAHPAIPSSPELLSLKPDTLELTDSGFVPELVSMHSRTAAPSTIEENPETTEGLLLIKTESIPTYVSSKPLVDAEEHVSGSENNRSLQQRGQAAPHQGKPKKTSSANERAILSRAEKRLLNQDRENVEQTIMTESFVVADVGSQQEPHTEPSSKSEALEAEIIEKTGSIGGKKATVDASKKACGLDSVKSQNSASQVDLGACGVVKKKGPAKNLKRKSDLMRYTADESGEPRVPCVSYTGMRFSGDDLHSFTNIGGKLAKSLEESTHLIASKIARTEKFLKAIPLGLHIINQEWFTDSISVGHFLDENDYALNDPQMESKYSFSLKASIEKAKKHKLLENMEFYICDKTVPPFKILEDIIKLSGGKVHRPVLQKKLLLELPENVVIIYPEGDTTVSKLFKNKPGRKIYSTEWIITSILTQTL